MIKVIWDDQAKAHTDHNIDDFLDDIILCHNTTGDVTVYVGQEIIIDVIRSYVTRGDINYKDILFFYNDEPIRCDKYGNLEKYPEDFCEYHNGILLTLLTEFEKKNERDSSSDLK